MPFRPFDKWGNLVPDGGQVAGAGLPAMPTAMTGSACMIGAWQPAVSRHSFLRTIMIGGIYLVILRAAAFPGPAHVEGAAAFSPVSVVLDVAFIAAAVATLTRRSRSAAVSQGTDSRVFRP